MAHSTLQICYIKRPAVPFLPVFYMRFMKQPMPDGRIPPNFSLSRTVRNRFRKKPGFRKAENRAFEVL